MYFAVRGDGPSTNANAETLRNTLRIRPRLIDGRDAPGIVTRRFGRHEQPERLDDAAGVVLRDLLPRVASPAERGARRCCPDASDMDASRGPLRLAAACLATKAANAIADPLGSALAGPPQVGAVHGAPLWVAHRERAPLTPSCRHGEHRVHHVAGLVCSQQANSPIAAVGGNDLADQLQLLVGQMTVRYSPRRGVSIRLRLHFSILSRRPTS